MSPSSTLLCNMIVYCWEPSTDSVAQFSLLSYPQLNSTTSQTTRHIGVKKSIPIPRQVSVKQDSEKKKNRVGCVCRLTEGHRNLDRGTGTGRSAMGIEIRPPAGGRPLLRDMSSTKVLVAATAAVQLLR